MNIDVRLAESPLGAALFRDAISAAPTATNLAFRWNAYLPLEDVLRMPWPHRIGEPNALLKVRWSTLEPASLNECVAAFEDQSLWPYRLLSVPNALVSETIAAAQHMWERVPAYVAGDDLDPTDACAFMVFDRASRYGIRPLGVMDVMGYLGAFLIGAA